MRIKTMIGIAGLILATATSQAGILRTDENATFRPTGRCVGKIDDSPGAVGRAKNARTRPGSNNGISYRGGPVMTDPTGVNVYYIWYGDWSSNNATTLLPALISNLNTSPYFNINTTYFDGSNKKVTNLVNWSGATSVGGSGYSRSLSDADILALVSNAISNKTVGPAGGDENAVYFVLTSADVTATSVFCTQYCGWHDHASIGGKQIKYSFVGTPDRCPSSCSAQSIGPSGNAGAYGMASIIAHELEEAVTDPVFTGWYDNRGYENADKCAWKFGATSTATNGALYIVTLGNRQYLIQQNWVNASGGYCDVKY